MSGCASAFIVVGANCLGWRATHGAEPGRTRCVAATAVTLSARKVAATIAAAKPWPTGFERQVEWPSATGFGPRAGT